VTDPKPTAADLIRQGTGLLHRRHLAELGIERRGIDAIFRQLPVVVISGYTRPTVRVEDYITLLDTSTYRGDRIRPVRGEAGLVERPRS
jgi:hypothetical protein